MREFVHLHVHTEYSLLDGISEIVSPEGGEGDLIKAARENNFRALAITDHGNMFGVPEFYVSCRKAKIKPIIGCEFYVSTNPDATQKGVPGSRKNWHLTTIAKNDTGYRNLIKLSTFSYKDGFYYRPRIDLRTLKEHSEGLIVLSGCLQGEVPFHLKEGNFDGALKSAKKMKDIFADDFYIELMDNGLPDQKKVLPDLVEIARRLDLKTVATNDVHYSYKKDAAVQDIAFAIGTRHILSDKKRPRFETEEFYLKSASEMNELFAAFGPQVLDNSLEIAEKCNVEMEFEVLHLPEYHPPDGKNAFDYLKNLCEAGIKERYGAKPAPAVPERIDMELGVIKKMGFPSYFLIVWDFINYARENGIAVGPGRGSGAGSIVSYLLNITDVDPLKYGLLFERFLNPGRMTMPDLDIDFEESRRKDVIEYVKQKYGEGSVGQIITYNKMLAKGAIRDVGRVMDIPLEKCDKIAKLIPFGESVKTAGKTVDDIKKMASSDEKIGELLKFAERMEGRKRHFGVHAAGVVITPGEIREYVPLALSKNGLITQYDGDYLTRLGLLKVDFLGLKTLSVIKDAVGLIYENRKIRLDMREIPLSDKKTFTMLSKAHVTGVFQIESEGMRDILRKMKPTVFADISAVLALYRPGPMKAGMVDEFVERKNGKKPLNYPHPALEGILKETYGVILYQEQVMLIARELASFSLAQADVLRKAMGKKIMSVLEEQKGAFVQGCKKNGVPEAKAVEIFNTLAHFAEYGFNKSHSTAYALISYQTAYLKANYPLEFMTSLLNSVIGEEEKLSLYLKEAEVLKLKVSAPDINESGVFFKTRGDKEIIFGLLAVKNTGQKTCENIVEERQKNGKFKSINDFLIRMAGAGSFNKRAAEFFVKAGCFYGVNKASADILKKLDGLMASAETEKKDRVSGQGNLFAAEALSEIAQDDLKKITETQKLKYEKEALGFYFTGHPLAKYEKYFRYFRTSTIAGLKASPTSFSHILTGIVKEVKNKKSKKGNDFFVVKLEDLTGVCEIIGDKNALSADLPEIKEDEIIAVKGTLTESVSGMRLRGEKFYSAKAAFRKIPKLLKIYMKTAGLDESLVKKIVVLLKKYPGNTAVAFLLTTRKKGQWKWGAEISVTIDSVMLEALEEMLGEECWKIES
ncbi:MAG: DNA polymerase III subunit alpha [Elusimicrobia bacterium CG08_land_8_20_14_0_20_44_26]|nr:MAG: DNA polymerase III subunit alpha [Elusimicrobia bacterium CG08_land_8_20_14_0_20_44_26]